MRRITIAIIAGLGIANIASADTILPSDVSFSDGMVVASLTGVAGDPDAGQAVVLNRKLGNCLACHVNADMDDQPFHGDVAPPLDGVADRWTAEELRGIVSNPKMMFEGTIMPAFYRDAGLNRVAEKFAGKSILDAQQVEDVVAYLMTLNEE